MELVYTIYWICLAVGIGYTIIAFTLGGFGHGSHMAEGGDASQAAFHHDYGLSTGDGQAGDVGSGTATGHDMTVGDASPFLIGPFSPMVIAFFLTCFGATGILMKQIKMLEFVGVVIASFSGILLAWGMIVFFNRVLARMQSNSEVRLHSLIGTGAEVTVEIPANGVGEIAYVAMGSRNVSPARNETQEIIPRFSSVVIERVVGNVFFVRPAVEDELRALREAPPGDSVTR